MKIHFKDYRRGEVRLEIENKDDLWYISQIIEESDLCSGRTERKIKIGDGDNAKTIKKFFFLEIRVEKIEFHSFSGDLRISGKLTKGCEDVPQGQYHTFNIEIGTVVTIKKKRFYGYQIEKLEDSLKNIYTNILIIAVDRGEATFALLKKYGFEVINTIQGEVEHKVDSQKPRTDFFSDAINLAKSIETDYDIHQTIIASPSIWTKKLSELAEDKQLKSNIIFTVCNTAGKSAINEILKRDEIKKLLKNERATKELDLVEELLKQIAIGKKYAYGLKDVKEKIEIGAVEKLIITDSFIKSKRQNETFSQIEFLMDTVENTNGNITIVSGENEAGTKLNSLGGIAALLRYDVDY
jgi:protein pelota